MKTLAIYLVIVVTLFGADEPKKEVPTMPSEVTLTSGRVLKRVQVIRWEKERVVLKYAGGADPIAFSLIKSIPLEDLRAMQAQGKSEQEQRDAAVREAEDQKNARERAERERQERFEKLISEGSVAIGMTAEQVTRAWGAPDKKNISAGSYGTHEQWIYKHHLVYLDDGRLTSWQNNN